MTQFLYKKNSNPLHIALITITLFFGLSTLPALCRSDKQSESSLETYYRHRPIDYFLNNFFSDLDQSSFFQLRGSFPSLNMSESHKEIILLVELPGVDEKDIQIETSGHQLTVSGEKKNKHEEEDKKSNHYIKEVSYGKFSRTVSVPFDLEKTKVNASFSKGIITIKVEKPAEYKSSVKIIPIT